MSWLLFLGIYLLLKGGCHVEVVGKGQMVGSRFRLEIFVWNSALQNINPVKRKSMKWLDDEGYISQE